MPVAPAVSYPGVYIQEVPSDVRTITPVETATTAFIGRALRGPVNEPLVINSYADFQRVFGGLWLESKLGYAVSHFFLNGGSKAVIVRLFRPTPGAKEKASLTVKGEVFIAANAVLAAAKEAAKPEDVTGESVKKAAQEEADKYKDKGPAQDAAQAVLEAINKLEDAAEKDVIEETLQDINPDAIARDGIKSQATTAANAVLAVAKEAAEPAEVTGESVKEVAQKEAGKYKDKGPAQDAARVVLTAINKLADDADKKAIDQALEDIKPDNIAKDVAQRYSLILEAKYPGTWGNNLCVRITDVDSKVRKQLARQYGVKKQEDLFNLTVHDRETGATETFPNVTVVPGPRRLDKVLEHESELIAVAEGCLPVQRPPAHPDPEPGKSVWEDPNAHDGVAEEGLATDGEELTANEFKGSEAKKEGIYALEHADIFNLLCIPPYTEDNKDLLSVLPAAATYCEKRRAMLLVDPPTGWTSKDKAKDGFPIDGLSSDNAAIFFPRIQAPNPLRDNQVEAFAPSGAVAGIFARTDATRGVWKAPAGQEATLRGVVGLTVPLTDAENGELNPLGINCLRQVPAAGYVVWGARTTVGDDRLASQWKYIPVRRTALYIEESLYRGTQWAVFEPNDEPLWSQLRLNIGVFMHGLFRQGAFQGQSPKDAYFVKCDSTTTTQADIDRGIVNIVVGFAPLKPAEFVVLYIQQIAGQLAV